MIDRCAKSNTNGIVFHVIINMKKMCQRAAAAQLSVTITQ